MCSGRKPQTYSRPYSLTSNEKGAPKPRPLPRPSPNGTSEQHLARRSLAGARCQETASDVQEPEGSGWRFLRKQGLDACAPELSAGNFKYSRFVSLILSFVGLRGFLRRDGRQLIAQSPHSGTVLPSPVGCNPNPKAVGNEKPSGRARDYAGGCPRKEVALGTANEMEETWARRNRGCASSLDYGFDHATAEPVDKMRAKVGGTLNRVRATQ